MQFFVICVLIFLFIHGECKYFETSSGRYEGDFCEDDDGEFGNCTKIEHCYHAEKIIKNGGRPKICGYTTKDPIVCCSFESQKTGHQEKKKHFSRSKAYDACIKYHEMVCPTTRAGVERRKLIVADDTPPSFGQFPYMALLGFGEDYQKAHWWCGGAIISRRFVLTAAHCTTDGKTVVTFIRVGTPCPSDAINRRRLHRVLRIYRHPWYSPPQHYNDIALLYTNRKIVFNKQVRPACLFHYDEEEELDATVVGWGQSKCRNSYFDVLQYAVVSKYSDEECHFKFSPKPPLPRLKYGLDTATQMCYEFRGAFPNTCPDDSGGPLQAKNFHFPCLHTVIGLTSFGDKCGQQGQPGVYTRVSAFLPWIEKIVWRSPNTYNNIVYVK